MSSDPFIFIELGFNKLSEYILSQTSLLPILQKMYALVFTIAVPLSVLLLIIIFYCLERLKTIRKKEHHIYEAKIVVNAYDEKAKGDAKLTEKWSRILTHIESANVNDWSLAIIEADIILGEILDKLGYHGESIGEKLKQVEKGDFKTLNEAWEAHKVRNAIAHQGSDFVMNQREAKRVIGLYRQVFEEFYHI